MNTQEGPYKDYSPVKGGLYGLGSVDILESPTAHVVYVYLVVSPDMGTPT